MNTDNSLFNGVKLDVEMESLQKKLALIDLTTTTTHNSDDCFHLLLYKLQSIKLKMYAEKKHSRPHLHIDYGKHFHCASFSIKPSHILAGSLAKKYDKAITEWIDENQDTLLRVWEKLQCGEDPHPFVKILKGDT